MYSSILEFEVRDHGQITETMEFDENLHNDEIVRDAARDLLISRIYERGICKPLFRYIGSLTDTKWDGYTK